MADPCYLFGLVFESAFNKEIDFESDTIKCSLHTSSYTPDQDTHQYWDVSVDNEASGTGYSAGGVTLSNPTIGYDAGTNVVSLDAGDADFSGNEAAARYAVIYDDTPASNKPLIAYIDFGEDKTPTSLTFNANGIATVTVAALA
ncbi:hypothetical protein [Mycolicibacterium elephantis]|uniref:hypothetical protein n=1 Tax=Mycolicibacterium elephantis TaxID=81858 RepID=UPI0007EAB73E|nr:hypothetical protein [Mycolicibacterium elephantis]OBB20623.1 hypothetical protein A5762_15315 [Mycolicibacterium elephantis]